MQASLVCVRLKWLNIWDPPRAEWKPVGDTRLLGVWSVGVVRYATIVKGIMDIEDMVYKTNYFIISSYGYYNFEILHVCWVNHENLHSH